MDIKNKFQRSFNMSRIKASDTKPEIIIKKFIKDFSIPFYENVDTLPGKPDLFIPSLNLVIQIHGCFWHGHSGCCNFVIPKSNMDFWVQKINSNISRDKKILPSFQI